MQTRKFWCHYIGSDGNTPKRRSIELHNLADLVPNIPDNVHCETPVWYEYKQDDDLRNVYALYVQVGDKTALDIWSVFGDHEVNLMKKSDEQIEADKKEWLKNYYAEYKDLDEEKKQNVKKYADDCVKEDIMSRDKYLNRVKAYQSYTTLLLSGIWIPSSAICAYQEINSPFLTTLQALRKEYMKKREEEYRLQREQMRKREEEEKQREIEAEKKEQERLTEVAKKLKQGEHIKGCDVVSLCRRYGIKVHLRTVHNLQQVVLTINTNDAYTYPGEKAKLDGCFKTVTELYDYLQEHDAA